MAAVTPTITSLTVGSVFGKLCLFNSVNSGDGWASGIPDIVGIFPAFVGAGSTASTTGIGVTYTSTSGTIYLFPATQASSVRLLVLHGGAY